MRVHVTNDVVYSDLIRVRHRYYQCWLKVPVSTQPATKYADVHPGLGWSRGVVAELLLL